MELEYIKLKTGVIVRGLENYRQNGIDLLLLGLHNGGDISIEGTRSDALIAFKGGTFCTTNFDEIIERHIDNGHFIDCNYDKTLFLETVKSQI